MCTLFSPLGLSPGSLFTAILATKPDKVIIITSQKAAQKVDEIVSAVKKVDEFEFEVEIHTISDPFTGFVEGRKLAASLAKKKTDDNIVNITGGTTALQDAAQTIARLINAKEIATIDRRPYQKQQDEPYVQGELIEVDKAFAPPTSDIIT